jgi:hypothetical protein
MNYATAVSSPRGLVGSSRAQKRAREEQIYGNSTQMKQTLKQKFRAWLFDENQSPSVQDITIDEDSIQLSRDKSIRFEIHNASGGRIVQTRRYDSQKDRHIENLYIITSDMEFGREIDKIITMEALR